MTNLRIIALAALTLFLANCAQSDLTPTIGAEGESQDSYNTVLSEPLTGETLPQVSEPIQMPAITNQLLEQVELDTAVQEELNEASKEGNQGGILGFIQGLFNGNNTTSSSNTIGTQRPIIPRCALLNVALGVGGTLISGGNPLIGQIISQVPGLLFNCGGQQTAFSSLIPQGASSQNSIFQFLAQVIQSTKDGASPFELLAQVQNPQDIEAMIQILQQLTNQSHDQQLESLLSQMNFFKNVVHQQ